MAFLSFGRTKYERTGIAVIGNHLDFVTIKDAQCVNYGTVVFDNILDAAKKIANHAKNTMCLLAVPQRIALLKTLQFDEIYSEQEVSKIVKLNSSIYFSCPVELLNYDFEYLSGGKVIRLLGGKKGELLPWINAFKVNDIRLAHISIDVLAIEQFLNELKCLNDNTVYVIVLHLYESVLMVVMSDGRVMFSNTVSLTQRTSLRDEVIKLFCLCECQNLPAINEVIIFSNADHLNDLRLTFPAKILIYKDLEKFIGKAFPLSCLLPWGVAM